MRRTRKSHATLETNWHVILPSAAAEGRGCSASFFFLFFFWRVFLELTCLFPLTFLLLVPAGLHLLVRRMELIERWGMAEGQRRHPHSRIKKRSVLASN